MDNLQEHWASGDVYDQFMGRWSWEVAIQFLNWLQIRPDQHWLDVGCGTGALARAIAMYAKPQVVIGFDPSVDFVRYARQQLNKGSFFVTDGRALAVLNETFDVIVSGLALNFMPQPEQALREMHRVIKPGGVVAAYVWDYAGKMEFLRYFWDAAVELDAGAVAMHEGNRFPICQPEPLQRLWQRAGFHNVSVVALEIPTIFDSFESYWQPFTLGNFPAPAYASSLDEIRRSNLRSHLHSTMPIAVDGTIQLIARVWAVRGYRKES